MAPGSWLDSVDFAADYPNEPLVAAGLRRQSPFAAALTQKNLSECSVFVGEQRLGWGAGAAYGTVKAMADSEETLLASGPQAADETWQQLAGSPPENMKNLEITIREYGRSGYGHGTHDWSARSRLPSMLGMLDAPGPMRPDDLTAYFTSLITKRRAEFAAWPEDYFGVWGFKIKTGDHNWINGSIWHEPGEVDDPSDPVEWKGSRSQIENTRYRDRFRHRVHLRTGSLRCFIERDDT